MSARTPQMRSASRRVGSWLLDRAAAALCAAGRRGDRRSAAHPSRITVLAFWGIGDAIHLTPMLRLLKEAWPRAEIEVVGPRFLHDLFDTEPSVDRVTVYEPPWRACTGKYRLWSAGYRGLVRWLRERRRSARGWVVTTRGDVREHLVASAMGAERCFGYGAGGGAALLTDDFGGSPPFARGLHGVEGGIEVAHRLGCRGEAGEPRLHLEPAEIEAARRDLAGLARTGGGPLLGVHAGASFVIRKWPAERFSAVLSRARDRIGGVVVIADPDGYHEGVRVPAGVPCRVFHGDLRRVLSLLACTDVLLCNDSGIMHAGAALGSRVVAVFGPTDVAWFAPFGARNHVVRDASIACGPCVDRCRTGTAHCMEAVDAERVATVLRRTLQEAAREGTRSGARGPAPRRGGGPPSSVPGLRPSGLHGTHQWATRIEKYLNGRAFPTDQEPVETVPARDPRGSCRQERS